MVELCEGASFLKVHVSWLSLFKWSLDDLKCLFIIHGRSHGLCFYSGQGLGLCPYLGLGPDYRVG